MTARQFIAPTKRRKMSKARRVKIFLSRNGKCRWCGNQIRDGEPWIIAHPDPIALGGSDADADLWPAHVSCETVQTTHDRKAIAKRNTAIDTGYAGRNTSRPMPGSRASGWRKRMNGRAERRT